MDNRAMGRPQSPPASLRALRLWHWRKVVLHRKNATRHEEDDAKWNKAYPQHAPRRGARAKAEHGKANWHLGAVQTLNELFPIGDYAEHDDV